MPIKSIIMMDFIACLPPMKLSQKGLYAPRAMTMPARRHQDAGCPLRKSRNSGSYLVTKRAELCHRRSVGSNREAAFGYGELALGKGWPKIKDRHCAISDSEKFSVAPRNV